MHPQKRRSSMPAHVQKAVSDALADQMHSHEQTEIFDADVLAPTQHSTKTSKRAARRARERAKKAASGSPFSEQLRQTRSSPATAEQRLLAPALQATSSPPTRSGRLDASNLISAQQHAGFKEYWPRLEVQRALEEGILFSCLIRFNQHDASQAFVHIPGVPTDVLIQVGA